MVKLNDSREQNKNKITRRQLHWDIDKIIKMVILGRAQNVLGQSVLAPRQVKYRLTQDINTEVTTKLVVNEVLMLVLLENT